MGNLCKLTSPLYLSVFPLSLYISLLSFTPLAACGFYYVQSQDWSLPYVYAKWLSFLVVCGAIPVLPHNTCLVDLFHV